MKANFDKSLALVLVHEGGYVNHPKDPGGATNRGVTQAVYDAYRKTRGKAGQSVKFITDEEVNAIYKFQYWDRVQGDLLPAGLDYAVFDFAVNSGVGRASKYLQAVPDIRQGQDKTCNRCAQACFGDGIVKLPTEEARNWFYAFLWPAEGVASAVILIWMITLIRWDWPAGTEEQRLTILGNIAYGMVGMMALVSLGLTMRNAIKNLKLQAGGMSAEAEAGDGK